MSTSQYYLQSQRKGSDSTKTDVALVEAENGLGALES